jgi:hypothetical protein
MSKFLRVLDGNYNIKVQDGGEITLDTGSQVGSVRITGNLIVEGDNTTVSSENTVFKDNIIVLNSPGKIYATFVGSITGNILTVTSIASGTILIGMSISWYDLAPLDSSIIGASQITVQVSGSLGGVGVYNIADTLSPAVSSRTITGEKLSSGGGSGVTLGTAGIRIDRGNLIDAELLYDESLSPYNPATATNADGAFILQFANSEPIGLRTNSISSGGEIVLQPGGSGAVLAYKVNYETFVTQNNHIPNKKYVDDEIAIAIATLAPTFIERGDTEVRVYDTALSDPISKATIEIDGVLKNTFLDNQVDFLQDQINLAEIRIQESTISAPGTGGDLVLQATGAQSVRIDDTLLIKSAAIAPTYDGIGLKLYTGAQSIGGTGLFYVNSTNTRDEIISKNRSLLFSMIF